MPDIEMIARVTLPNSTREIPLIFKPGGRRLNVGRAAYNDLTLNDTSVSKIYAALLMAAEGTLLVADTGSINGTYLNGRHISYGECQRRFGFQWRDRHRLFHPVPVCCRECD